MLFAKAAPKATGKPSVNGSDGTNKVAFEAINRLEGEAKGIRVIQKELNKTPSIRRLTPF